MPDSQPSDDAGSTIVLRVAPSLPHAETKAEPKRNRNSGLRKIMDFFSVSVVGARDENALESEHSIFLNHSGAQKSFEEQLCLDIEAHDRYPFFDKSRDSLPIGCDFPNLIFEAIQECQVAVVVLSEEYFSLSKWPMLELAALMKRKMCDPNLIIMPVFLGITHAQCREKENPDRWLKQWQCWADNDNRIIIEEWQAALKVFGYTNGISLNWRDEVRCRQEIVEAICKGIPPESRWDDSHVQGRSRLCKLKGLKRKSILENLGDGSKKIGMHDLWREFAFVIAQGGESDSRPWIYERVYHLDDPKREESHLSGGGWKSLQRECMFGEQEFQDLDRRQKYFVKGINLDCCSNLRLLKLVDVYPESQVLDVRSLKLLKSLEIHYNTHGSNLFHIPRLACLTNLVVLRLDGVQTDSLNEEIGDLSRLHVLHVRRLHSWSTAEKLPDLSRLNLLQDISCCMCIKAEMISGLNSKMNYLKRLDLAQCRLLRSCHGVGDLVALKELDLSACNMLEELPNLGRLVNLLELRISDCKLLKAVPGLGDLVSLELFRAGGCSKLATLQDVRKLINLQRLDVTRCPLIKEMPGLSNLIALEELEADYGGLEGCHDLSKLETVSVTGISVHGTLPCFLDLKNLTLLECGFKNMQFLSNLTTLKDLTVGHCHLLDSLPDMHNFTRLERLIIRDCKNLREWKTGSRLRLFGVLLESLHTAGIPLQLQTLVLNNVAFTKLPDLRSFPQFSDLSLRDSEELTSLISSAPLTALESLELVRCRNLRALPDLSHLVSLSYFELENCGVQSTAHEIEELETLCPGLILDMRQLSRPHREHESDVERAEKRLKVGGYLRALNARKLIRTINKLTFAD